MTKLCDYETRWRILGCLILSEMQQYDFVLEKSSNSDLRNVMRWMLAIDAGIRDAERIKEVSMEDDKK